MLVFALSVRVHAYELLTVRIGSYDDRLFEKAVRLGGVSHHFMFRPYSRVEVLGVVGPLDVSSDGLARSIAGRLRDDLEVEGFGSFGANPLSGAFIGGGLSDDERTFDYEFRQYIALGRFFVVEGAERCDASLKADKDDESWAEFGFSELLARLGFFGLALSFGRGELWWGEGRWGTLVLSNNAPPLDHVRFETDRPLSLGPLGSLKFAAMMARLEDERYVPNPLLLGGGVSWLVGPVELGAVRTVMFGGEGKPLPGSASDWTDLLLAKSEHTWGRGLDTDQLLNVCGRLSIPEVRKLGSSLRYFGLYFEYGAESAMGGLPASIAHVLGAVLDFGHTDVRLEYAETENPSPWYEHYVYKSGYTHEGRVMGHHIGCCSRGAELEVNRYLSESFVIRLRSEVTRYERRDIIAADMAQGVGVWGAWRGVQFDLDVSAGRKSRREAVGAEDTEWYGAGSASLGISIP